MTGNEMNNKAALRLAGDLEDLAGKAKGNLGSLLRDVAEGIRQQDDSFVMTLGAVFKRASRTVQEASVEGWRTQKEKDDRLMAALKGLNSEMGLQKVLDVLKEGADPNAYDCKPLNAVFDDIKYEWRLRVLTVLRDYGAKRLSSYKDRDDYRPDPLGYAGFGMTRPSDEDKQIHDLIECLPLTKSEDLLNAGLRLKRAEWEEQKSDSDRRKQAEYFRNANLRPSYYQDPRTRQGGNWG
jgi:hypothetical protein